MLLLSDRGLIKLISQHATCEEALAVVVVRLYFKRVTLDINKADKFVAIRKKKKIN